MHLSAHIFSPSVKLLVADPALHHGVDGHVRTAEDASQVKDVRDSLLKPSRVAPIEYPTVETQRAIHLYHGPAQQTLRAPSQHVLLHVILLDIIIIFNHIYYIYLKML